MWLTKDPSAEPVEKGPNHERGTYVVFNPNIFSREETEPNFLLKYDALEVDNRAAVMQQQAAAAAAAAAQQQQQQAQQAGNGPMAEQHGGAQPGQGQAQGQQEQAQPAGAQGITAGGR